MTGSAAGRRRPPSTGSATQSTWYSEPLAGRRAVASFAGSIARTLSAPTVATGAPVWSVS